MKRIKLLGKISALIIMTGLAFCTLTSQAEEISAKSRITEAVVTEDKQNVQIKAENSSDMQGTDGKYYLFELKAYENEMEQEPTIFKLWSREMRMRCFHLIITPTLTGFTAALSWRYMTEANMWQ